MRPAEIGPALVKAAEDFVREIQQMPEAERTCKGATLAEIAVRACVGQPTARHLVPKLKSRGHLQIVGQRKVDYRNRPVAEYAPVPRGDLFDESRGPSGAAVLGNCLQAWAR